MLGLDRFRPLVKRFGRILTLDCRAIGRADGLFDRYDRWFLCFGRMVPTIRSLVSIPAGLFGMRVPPFLIRSTIGTAGWTGALAGAGYALGRDRGDLAAYVGPVSNGIVISLIAGYLYRVVTWRPRRG